MPLPYDLSRVDLDYLEGMLGDVAETSTLEFKTRINLDDEKKRVEFCCDVASFANEAGGDIVVGIGEREAQGGGTTGVAGKIVGIDADEVDGFIGTWSTLLRDRTEPRVLPDFYPIDVGIDVDGVHRKVVVIRVPRSGASPHGVRDRDTYRFCGRYSTGKYAMNVSQIRERFALNGRIEERIENWVESRVTRVLSKPPVPLEGETRWVTWVLPQRTLLHDASLDVERAAQDARFTPRYDQSCNARMNANGALLFGGDFARESWYTYAQLFRDGRVERVDGSCSIKNGVWDEATLVRTFHFLHASLRGLSAYGIEPPYYVAGALLNAEGKLLVSASESNRSSLRIDTDRVDLPIVVFEEAPRTVLTVANGLLPHAEVLLHAGGSLSNQFYDEAGSWLKPYKLSPQQRF